MSSTGLPAVRSLSSDSVLPESRERLNSGAGDPIAKMASLVGYPTFAIEHMMFGMALAAFIRLASPKTETTTNPAPPRPPSW